MQFNNVIIIGLRDEDNHPLPKKNKSKEINMHKMKPEIQSSTKYNQVQKMHGIL